MYKTYKVFVFFKVHIGLFCDKYEMFLLEIIETIFFVILVQRKGWYALYLIEETKLVCAISRKYIIGWKT